MKQNYPSVLDRTKSNLIDTILLIACMLLFTDVLDKFANVPSWARAILFLSLLMYEPICTTFGATLGNDKMKIRVRKNSNTNERLNLFQAIFRYFFKIIFGWISFITIFISPKSRTIHDIIVGSVMVKAE
jgi:uncharacterized RDD family membrane protein YckC